jgi:hypothetical protein
MTADPGYSPNLPMPADDRDRSAPPAFPVIADVQRRKVLVTNGELLFMGVEAFLVLVLLGYFLVLKPDYVNLLWTHPTGIKMLLGAAVLLIINFGAFLGTCMLVNHWAPPGNEDRRAVRVAVHWLVGGILAILFYFPVLFVLLVGPAAIAIEQNLAGP